MAALISQTDLEAHKVCLQGPLVDALLTSTPLHLPLPPHPKKMALQKEKRVKVYQSNLKLFISANPLQSEYPDLGQEEVNLLFYMRKI